MLRHFAGLRPSMPDPVLRHGLAMSALYEVTLFDERLVNDMLQFVQFWNSLASLLEGCPSARVSKGGSPGITARSLTWAGSVMKTVLAVGYPYPIEAHSMHSIDLPAIKDLFQCKALRGTIFL